MTSVFALSSLWLTAQSEKLAVFIACNCDRNYIRQEISYVDHVRDQALADVQIQINQLGSGNGGRTYDLNFIGRKMVKGLDKTLTYQTSPTMTRDEIRAGLTQKIGIGLLHYLLETDKADHIKVVSSGRTAARQQKQMTEDQWKSWIFEVYGKGSFDKESSRGKTDIGFGFEGDKVTEEWRIRADVHFNHYENRYESDEGETLVTRERAFARGSIVRSLGNHWSAGIFSGFEHNTYRNLDLSFHFQPALEYNLFPYREVMRREITFAYKLGAIHNRYLSPTIYNRMKEQLFRHSLDVQIRFRQPWGDVFTTLEASSYLHDLSKNRLELDSYTSVRVFKGLSVRLSLNLQLVRDQLNLPSGDATLEDLLLRQRQIATDFEASGSIGLSYTFGSAFNNIVNTRL